MKVILSVIALITVVAAGIVYSYDPLFWSRYGGLLKSQLLQQPRGLWYSPLETVAGGEGSPLRYWSQQNLQIPAAALDNAEHYVAARRTSSFIVWHNGAVARERYFDG
ncbi:MAG: hypothetical protein MJA84_01505, partial [Firmicutes bacterium]|nr:hypothetical protein [Bacillota bacterium]